LIKHFVLVDLPTVQPHTPRDDARGTVNRTAPDNADGLGAVPQNLMVGIPCRSRSERLSGKPPLSMTICGHVLAMDSRGAIASVFLPRHDGPASTIRGQDGIPVLTG
jgi:hypothetical protein